MRCCIWKMLNRVHLTEAERERERERNRDTETERERETDSERERERERLPLLIFMLLLFLSEKVFLFILAQKPTSWHMNSKSQRNNTEAAESCHRNWEHFQGQGD